MARLSPREVFFTKTVREGDCLIWTGAQGGSPRHRYGVFRGMGAHRWAYIEWVGPIPPGLVLDHEVCDRKLCVNYEHLRPKTQRKNLLRSKVTVNSINAAKTHCSSGHEFTEENTYLVNSGRGSKGHGRRACRTCKREWARARRKK